MALQLLSLFFDHSIMTNPYQVDRRLLHAETKKRKDYLTEVPNEVLLKEVERRSKLVHDLKEMTTDRLLRTMVKRLHNRTFSGWSDDDNHVMLLDKITDGTIMNELARRGLEVDFDVLIQWYEKKEKEDLWYPVGSKKRKW